MRKPQPLADRFARNVIQAGDGCWLWTGNQATNGYGRIWVNGTRRMEMAHRVSYYLANGPMPDGAVICHSCDTPLCVRPDHLFLGSQGDNLMDMHLKRRHPGTKLTDADVREIRRLWSSGMTQTAIAQRYRVWQTTISEIVRGRTFQHVA